MDQNEPVKNEKRRVIEAEIINPGESGSGYSNYQSRFGSGFTQIWAGPMVSSDGCLSPAITLAIFFVILGQYGLLAAIGFAVFYAIGSVFCTFYAARRLVAGIPIYNIWPLRCANWLVSFLLTAWLAGGFAD